MNLFWKCLEDFGIFLDILGSLGSFWEIVVSCCNVFGNFGYEEMNILCI